MCGIVGSIGFPITRDRLENAIASLHHRGPDGHGHFIAGGECPVGLGHARLSIIDLMTGDQPLYDEDRDIVLVANGEIYDFEKIRANLELSGHRFRTKSDSEVIIHLYKEYGLEMFEHLRGEFAFILYDKVKEKVICARDRFGIKPLYLAQKGDNLVLASEAKGIFATGLVEAEIDAASVRNMLSFAPVDSIFRGVTALPPAHYLEVDLKTKKQKIEPYWTLDLPSDEEEESPGDLDRCAELVRKKVDEAVRLRMRADVPVGVYLSGGIDSAAIAGSIAKNHPNELKAFTISFPGEHQFDELTLATRMAKSIGAELHIAKCDNETLLNTLADCLWYSEIPTVNLHNVGKFLLSQLAGKHVKVVLSGEGSDETFLGYGYFKNPDHGITKMFNQLARRESRLRQNSPMSRD